MRKPWYRRQTRCWYVELVGGKQLKLGKDARVYDRVPRKWPAEIDEAWHQVMASHGELPPDEDLRIGDVVRAFLRTSERENKPQTVAWYRVFLEDFAGRNPRLRASRIRQGDVDKWLFADRKRPWGQTTRRSAITILKRCLNWAVKAGTLAENPVRHMERPPVKRRERTLDAAERQSILGLFPEGDPFRDFLVALQESGCRPGEVMKVVAKDVNLELGIWVLHGKTSDTTGRKRVIYLTPILLELTRELVRRYPVGPIFRNADGNPWTSQAVNCRFRRKRVRKTAPIDGRITAYTYRHTFTTDALVNGVPIATVSELLGHSSTQMVSQHYSHLSERTAHLREQAERATKRPPQGDTPATDIVDTH